ncbi:hypothetical protein PoB_002955600, partial [Plakobranchus ocellatus]
MCRKKCAVLLYCFLGIATAQQPSLTIVTSSSSFSCNDDFLVVGEDFVTFELDLSGNNSDYTYDIFDGPRFRLQELVTENGNTLVASDYIICEPFDLPQDGFCVKRDITNTTGCSCEAVGPQVYRVKAVYRIEDVSESRGRLELRWPSLSGPISAFYSLPEVRATSMAIVRNSSSFLCGDEYLVVGEDFVTFEVDVSGNSPDYTYDVFDGPRFRLQTPRMENGISAITEDQIICLPFDLPENGFCVRRDIVDTTGCSCEAVGPQVYRVKAVYRIEDVSDSRGRIQLLWPSITARELSVFYYLPEVRDSSASQEPSMAIVQNSSSFLCGDEYLVVGEDFVTFEVELSGNSPDYTYDVFDGPRFRLQTLRMENGISAVTEDLLICLPFDLPQNGFCVKRDIVDTTGCSCEAVGPQVYRVKVVYRIEEVSDSRGRVQLLWPSITARELSVFYYLPEVRHSSASQEPSMAIVQNSSSFLCGDEYLVVGEDYVTFEVELSGNSPDYTYDAFDGPRFRLQTLRMENGISAVTEDLLFCLPFDYAPNEFCVKRHITNTTGCSCEVVGPQVYRVKAVYRIEDVSESRGRVQLLWPSLTVGDLSVYYYLPEVR